MGVSSNSHGKKSDKECQSPMLKIFKDIMQKEKHDPEKANLLQNKKEERKKKYFNYRNKTERRSRESSSSEQRKRGNPYKTSMVEQRTAYDDCRTQSIPFHNEKRDSWFFWGETEKTAKPTEDTCSCVSCALRKIVSSEYACVGCLVVILTISIVVAFLVVCKNVPTLVASEKQGADRDKTLDSERLKRKIDLLNNRKNDDNKNGFEDKSHWKDSPVEANGLSEIAGSDFGPGFRELDTMNDESKFIGDLNNILDNDKINEMQNSERLRDFYRKLMQIDTQIRNLKKTNGNTDSDIDLMKTSDRIKRSLKFHNQFKRKFKTSKNFKVNKSHNKTGKACPMKMKLTNRNRRFKRIGNYTNQPMGFVIEKKKVLIHYKPSKLRKVAKCSHQPKDSNAHEKQLNHPFYKNSQRLDELLDTFLTKNLPDVMSDPFGLDKLFKIGNEKDKHSKEIQPSNKHFKNQKKVKEEKFSNSDVMKILSPESTTNYQKDLLKQKTSLFNKEKANKQHTTTKSDYDIVLSVSTILNPGINRIGKTPSVPLVNMVPNIRRLMQLESDDDDNLGYEDLKEVLPDDLNNHDEVDRNSNDRKKIMDESKPQMELNKNPNPLDVHNHNWKGPMPLYPDELNTAFKQAAVNSNTLEYPINAKDLKLEIYKTEKDLNDVDYVEDYLNNKYDKLVEMAQAYSDYGVLDGKKIEKEKNSAADEKTEPKVTLSLDTIPVLKRELLQGRKKNPYEMNSSIVKRDTLSKLDPSEGIRFEMRPTTKAREDLFDLSKMIKNHLKITNEENIQSQNQTNSHFNDFSTYPFIEMMYNTIDNDKSNIENQETKSGNSETSTLSNAAFSFGFAKRSLLSIDLERDKDIKSTTTNKDSGEKSEDKYYEVTTLYKVTDIKNNHDFEGYASTVVYKKDTHVNIDTNIETEKTSNSSYENQLTVNKNKLTATNIIKKDLKNASTSTSNEIHKVAGTERITTDVSSKNKRNQSTNDSISKLDEILKPTQLVSSNDTKTLENSNQFKIFLVSDEDDQNVDDYLDSYSFPLVIYFNEDTRDNNSDIEIKIITTNEGANEIDTNNAALNKRDLTNTSNCHTEDTSNTSKLEFNQDKTLHKTDVINITKHYPDVTDSDNDYILNKTNYNNNNSVVANEANTEMSISDIFMRMSDWFAALDGVDFKPKNNASANATESFIKSHNESNTTDTMYPMYDSEMIENIGHRSRVLLSVDNRNNITEKRETDDANISEVKSPDVGKSESNLLNASIATKYNSTQERDATAITDDKAKDGNTNKNRTIVKRNTDESSLIFWNDIYDDEYGIEMDRLEDAMRDKHSATGNGFIKKSGLWMQQKIKQLTQNLKKTSHVTSEATPTKKFGSTRRTQDSEIQMPEYVYDKAKNQIRKRETENEEDDYDSSQKSIFAAMTSHMREVCKKAAKAVQKTRNIEVRQESKQETIATSLMQQLVQLMNDLVGYQVQQKTCAKLPPDLKKFLEWLTSPEDERSDNAQTATFRNSYQDDVTGDLDLGADDKINHQSMLFTNENIEVHTKSDSLGTLHDVQELMHQYEAMSDEDKVNLLKNLEKHHCIEKDTGKQSKMTGVKKYLEDQLDFLNKRISGYNDYNFDIESAPIRLRRHLAPHRRFKRRLRKKLHKFIRNFGKKHTRTTASYNDEIQITESKRKTEKKSVKTNTHDGNENNDRETIELDDNEDGELNESKDFNDNKRLVKRNLKDVYFKAVEDAKRYTTVGAVQSNVKKGKYDGNEDIKQ